MNPLDALLPIIDQHAQELKKPGVLSVRPGYRLQDGWPTTEPAIIVITASDAGAIDLPAAVGGVPVERRTATRAEALRHADPERYARLAAQRPELAAGAFRELDPVEEGLAPAPSPAPAPAISAKPQIPYTPAPNASLAPVSGTIPLLCHASPDAGWPTLRDFLAQTQSSLTVGLYDFTSAHILQALENDLAGPGKQLVLTLDHPALNPTADQSDPATVAALAARLGAGFQSAWALVRANPAVQRWIYPSAYHIKVAVRDGRSVWLSSGNWNNSNQPDMDPIGHPAPTDQDTARSHDRDWHVVVDHQGLASTYAAFLEHDFLLASANGEPAGPLLAEQAEEVVPAGLRSPAAGTWRFFAPLRIQNEPVTITPLLTPDPGVYQQAMLNLIKSARSRLYIQLQYIHPSDQAADAPFTALVDAVAATINAGQVDVRIILSQYQTSQGWLERLQAAGVNLQHVKIQNGVHNKGFVVDSRMVALGSQNWSGDGVLRNRDASVIIENQRAAQYYEGIFLHDWDNIAVQKMS